MRLRGRPFAMDGLSRLSGALPLPPVVWYTTDDRRVLIIVTRLLMSRLLVLMIRLLAHPRKSARGRRVPVASLAGLGAMQDCLGSNKHRARARAQH